MLLSILQIDPARRKKYNCVICIELMKQLWPEVLDEPINPIIGLNLKKRFVVLFRKKPRLFSFLKKIKNMQF